MDSDSLPGTRNPASLAAGTEDYDDLGLEDQPQIVRLLYGPFLFVPYGLRDLTRHLLVPVALPYVGIKKQVKRPAPSEKPAPRGTPDDVPLQRERLDSRDRAKKTRRGVTAGSVTAATRAQPCCPSVSDASAIRQRYSSISRRTGAIRNVSAMIA